VAAEGELALGLNRVVFEADYQTLVNAMKTRSYDLSVIGVLQKEIQSQCIGSFELFDFCFAPHSCNKVAHSLEQYGLRADTECTSWEGFAPEFISDVVASDVAVRQG
jgi:hypothetical protein